ncbi:NADH-ubiquinone oxidoreductase chain K [hydrothermal vent metagenome]|uniref:NADH-ubiquinone oxidoreductase chain K n=1 Tax=hydrothermal vent metagenome TaxID=652676 RepID=A0A3B0QPF4_9ZZZZ
MVPLTWFIGLGLILFMIGVSGVLLRKNIIIVLMSIELMLNSVNINLVAFSYYLDDIRGQIFAIFTITVAAAEVAVALGILIALVRNRRVLNSDDMDSLKG